MTVDAVVLAGGRSTRLGGVAKASLTIGGRSLLERAVAAASACRQIVVVGERMPGALYAREEPAFGGPAAGLAAGLRELQSSASADAVLVLACDMPFSEHGVGVLLAAQSRLDSGCDGLVAVDESGRRQPLLALYSASALHTAVDRPDLDGLSMRALLASLRLVEIVVPAGSADDVDTWSDAERLGVSTPQPAPDAAPLAQSASSIASLLRSTTSKGS